jgi:hypothetical protein
MNNSRDMNYSRVVIAVDSVAKRVANVAISTMCYCEERSDVAISLREILNMRSPRFARDDNFLNLRS